MKYRTHNCGELSLSDLGKKVRLCGWIAKIRDKGSILWFDLRDIHGLTQVVLSDRTSYELLAKARTFGREYVLQIEGVVIERVTKNDKISTGDIEIEVTGITVLNESKIPPFTIEDNTDGGLDLRMEHRYLDLRRNIMQKNLIFRHEVAKFTRDFLYRNNFFEIETPVLVRPAPEGARAFVVPSRMYENQWYALAQSPQLFKQMLMIGGYDRYFQIAKCFRDEDFRADRQPEFTQIDCELSFVTQDEIIELFEKFIIDLFKKLKNIEFYKFERMTYKDAMNLYGCDKPDLRYNEKFIDITIEAKKCETTLFQNCDKIIALVIKNSANLSRAQIEEIESKYNNKKQGNSPLCFIKYLDGKISSALEKSFSEDNFRNLCSELDLKQNDLVLILGGSGEAVLSSMGAIRTHFIRERKLERVANFRPLWVIDFPLLEWSEDDNRFYARHHPFTSANKEDLHLLDENPGNVRANAYDLVINGIEIGGGSIRISSRIEQERMLEVLSIEKEYAEKCFGFLLKGLEYGAPPHGGIAFGIDRLCAVMEETDTIRDYIAFPKNSSGRDVMMDAPAILK